MNTSTNTVAATPPQGHAEGQSAPLRPNSATFPIWRIQGTWKLQTPLHLGSGQDEEVLTYSPDPKEQVSQQKHTHRHASVAQLATDHTGRPYLPASSYKGALRNLAMSSAPERSELWHRLFGSVKDNKTTPASVEFCNAYDGQDSVHISPMHTSATDPRLHPHSYSQHVARKRDTATAEESKLFINQHVPAGGAFAFECTLRGTCEADLAELLAILEATSSTDQAPSAFQLGGKKAADMGRVTWELTHIQKFQNMQEWVQRDSNLPLYKLSRDGLLALKNKAQAHTARADFLHLSNLALDFSTPFLAHIHNREVEADGKHKPADKRHPPQGQPRSNKQGQYILPSTSLHGALRAQAEAILRTLNICTQLDSAQPQACPQGHEVLPVQGMDQSKNLDLASLLFGAPGWRSVVQCTDFAVEAKDVRLIPHDMLAIDRITGGGKDGAKFSLQVLDCPMLKGRITVDLARLNKTGHAQQALGLLAHTLRDLDEGDIPLGYGASKGYGVSTSQCWKALESELKSAPQSTNLSWADCLSAFAKLAKPCDVKATLEETRSEKPQFTPQINTPQINTQQINTAQTNTSSFHNPYVFLPFAPETGGSLPTDDLPRDKTHGQIKNTHHSHAQYSPQAFHGRLTVKLTTQTPIFVGAQRGRPAPNEKGQQTDGPTPVAPFRLRGEIALPATSLRGMLSSLHESITRSAMRVAGNAPMSVRVKAEDALPHAGKVVVRKNEEGKSIACVQCHETAKLYPITKSAMNTLYALADLRYEQDPNFPRWDIEKTGLPSKGGREKKFNWLDSNTPPRLEMGGAAMVFFRLDATKTKVVELAWSQIWRKAIAQGGEHYLPMHASPKPTHPFTDQWARKTDTPLSPTEWMFGFVQEKSPSKNSADGKDSNHSAAFTSKVRVGWGTSASEVLQCGDVTLKILAAPKPPSPAMYFKPRDGDAYVSKSDLAKNPSNYELRGRKVYLHALRKPDEDGQVQDLNKNGYTEDNEKTPVLEPWRSHYPNDAKTAKQKVCINPIAAGQAFSFHIDFKNLSQAELESLCASVLPHDSFEHKLGMGKPLGLGSVKLSIENLELIDRQARYRETDFSQAQRYNCPYTSADAKRMAQHMMASLESTAPALYRAIVISGDPKLVKAPVHYPQVPNQDIEQKTFQWFVENDRINAQHQHQHQHLHSFDENSATLHPLNRMPETVQPQRRN